MSGRSRATAPRSRR
jgi:putative transposase